jgi:hypothetical protein
MKFGKSTGQQKTQVQQLLVHLRNTVEGGRMITPESTKTMFALESAQDFQLAELNNVHEGLSTAIESIVADLGLGYKLTPAQITAGSIAGMIAADPRHLLSRKTISSPVAMEGAVVVQTMGAAEGMSERAFGLEAYDERENRNASIYSIAYNMQSARQDEFGETFFPTLVLTPDQVGFGITVDLMTVFDATQHNIDGAFRDFGKKNIIRAVADASILKKEQTRVIPAVRPQNAAQFVDPAIVAPAAVIVEGQSITTAPLKIGKELNLISVGQTDALLATGVMDNTDTLDTFLNLKNVYVKFGADVLRFNVSNLPLANFTYSTQNNYRVMTLNFETTSVLINRDTKQADGSALVDLAGVVAGNLIARVELKLTGSVNIETGKTSIYGNAVQTHVILDSTGQQLDQAVAPAAPVVAVINVGTIEGYDLTAFYTNINRRQRGQLIDVTKFTQLYAVPLRSPISAMHPAVVDASVDATDVQALISATRIRVSNEAVSALIDAAGTLAQYVDAADVLGEGPDVLGVGRFFVRPTYFQETLDMATMVDSIKSFERAQDMQAALVNKLRDYAYRMYRDSEYKAAADALSGGISAVPVVIIGTDPVLARYLNVSGDLRTLGGEFDVRIVSTLDSRVAGKIFMTFGVFNEQRNTAPNPLNFGNMVWGPELVMTANLSRGNTYSKETVVQPRYAFVTHLPIMTTFVVNNVPAVLNKIPVNFHQI